MLYIYVAINNGEEELVTTTSNHDKKYRILSDYRKKAKEEHNTYRVRVVETRHTVYM